MCSQSSCFALLSSLFWILILFSMITQTKNLTQSFDFSSRLKFCHKPYCITIYLLHLCLCHLLCSVSTWFSLPSDILCRSQFLFCSKLCRSYMAGCSRQCQFYTNLSTAFQLLFAHTQTPKYNWMDRNTWCIHFNTFPVWIKDHHQSFAALPM